MKATANNETMPSMRMLNKLSSLLLRMSIYNIYSRLAEIKFIKKVTVHVMIKEEIIFMVLIGCRFNRFNISTTGYLDVWKVFF